MWRVTIIVEVFSSDQLDLSLSFTFLGKWARVKNRNLNADDTVIYDASSYTLWIIIYLDSL